MDLVYAIKAGATHVMILAGHRETSDTLDKPETQQMIEFCHLQDVPIILTRFLLGTQRVKTLYDPRFYIEQIALVREEALRVGAKYTGFDTEAYQHGVINTYFKLAEFNRARTVDIAMAVGRARGAVGQVDYILPAGSVRPHHPLVALARLGRNRISETTYYDRNVEIPYPWEITGLYISTSKKREGAPYYLPSEVRRFRRVMLWHEHPGVAKLWYEGV